MTLGSAAAETDAGVFMEPSMPGIAVIVTVAPENCLTKFSENSNSIFWGASPVAPSAGLEDNNLGCARAAALATTIRNALAARTTVRI